MEASPKEPRDDTAITQAPIDEEERFDAPRPSGRWAALMAKVRGVFKRRG